MAGKLTEAESILNECGNEVSTSGLTATCNETSLWCGLGCFPAGLRQAGAWGSSLREVYREDTQSFFLIPKDQAGYSSDVFVTGIKRNCYFDNSGLLETNKEKSLLYIK